MRPAFLFPGQGTQREGMAVWIRRQHAPAVAMFEAASELLGYDLAALCAHGPREKLQRTEYAQPSVFVAGCAYASYLMDSGVLPGAVAGHSVGEYGALVSAGALEFTVALELVRDRGLIMAEVAGGEMAALRGATKEEIVALVDEVDDRMGDRLAVAVVNGERDIVVSGSPCGIQRAIARLPSAVASHVRVTRPRVGGAFHSPLMAPQERRWSARLESVPIQDPTLPVALNATGRLARDAEEIRRALADHLTSTVQWAGCLATIKDLGIDQAVECGEGRSLRSSAEQLGIGTPVGRGNDGLRRFLDQVHS